jgi:hypothetical protein
MTSIRNPEADVQAEHPAEPQNANTPSANPKAAVESTVYPSNDVSNASLNEGRLLLARELKERISFQALLEADRHQFKASGQYSMCRCPFHADSTPSFSVLTDDDTRGKCFGCGWYGDIFAYEMEFHRVDFKEAWFRLNDFVKQHPRAGRKAKAVPKQKIASSSLTDKQVTERKAYAQRLATDRWIAERICQKRHESSGQRWNPDTLQKLAQEGSLGWAGDALAFLYPTGTKYRRWPHKELVWECEGISLWRGDLLPAAAHVYLTESETDAIALIDSGIEKTPGTVVIAAPSATSFKQEWGEQFKGKTVTLCFDNDSAGEHAVQTVAFALKPHATAILTVDWKEVA